VLSYKVTIAHIQINLCKLGTYSILHKYYNITLIQVQINWVHTQNKTII